MSQAFDTYIISAVLDRPFPLGDGTYLFLKPKLKGALLTVRNTFVQRERIGSFQTNGDIHSQHGEGSGSAEVTLIYECLVPLTTDGFASVMEISQIWYISHTGWSFILEELNRIIDLYRNFTNQYWWGHLSAWNVDELKIHAKLSGTDQARFLASAMTPKLMKFGGLPLEDCAYAIDSPYVRAVSNGQLLPFYYLLYLNGRRSFGEHAFREALINWANCTEAFAAHILKEACRRAALSSEEVAQIERRADTYQKKYSRAYEVLGRAGIYPSINKKEMVKLYESVMEYRNDVMHGSDLKLQWEALREKFVDLSRLINIANEIVI